MSRKPYSNCACVSDAALLMHGLMSRTVMMHRGALTKAQSSILFGIASNGSATMGQVASLANITRAQATRSVAELVDQGLVERFHPENNRRIVKLSLTEKGQALMAEQKRDADKALYEELDRLDPEDRLALLEAAQTCHDILQKLL